MTGITLDYEAADRITLLVLQDTLKILTSELQQHKENGAWMHPEDVYNSENKYIPALKTMIEYFGGDYESGD